MGNSSSSSTELTRRKVAELRSLPRDDALAIICAAGVTPKDGLVAVERLQDIFTPAELFQGLAPESCDALRDLAAPSRFASSSTTPSSSTTDLLLVLEEKQDEQEHGPVQNVERWKKGKQIGHGSFGHVYQGLNLDTGALIAIKSILLGRTENAPESKEELEETQREIRLMSELSHENIVAYLGAQVDSEQPRLLHIFQEWVPGGSLAHTLGEYGGKFEDSITSRYVAHVLCGLAYLHERRIVHRDIKAENILISDAGVAKLADFGASKKVGAEGTLDETGSLRGTPYYMAPEQVKQRNVGRKCDIWAIGGVAMLCGCGQPPWMIRKHRSHFALMNEILESEAGPPLESYTFTADLADFIAVCFQRDPEQRPAASELQNHAFVKRHHRPTRKSLQSVSLPPTREEEEEVAAFTVTGDSEPTRRKRPSFLRRIAGAYSHHK